jgi:hypothetical protein
VESANNEVEVAMSEPQSVIQEWMQETVSNGGIERYDDLHIDQIDAAWKPRDKWLQGAFESFELALRLRDRLPAGTAIVLAFHLTDGERPLGLSFKTPQEFERNLSATPPSLYLMHRGAEFWTQTLGPDLCDVNIEQFAPATIWPSSADVAAHFMEFKRISTGEYTRSLFIHSK